MTAEQVADLGAPPPDSLSAQLFTRIWHIMQVRGYSPMDLHLRTQIPMDTLFALYRGEVELTAEQLVRCTEALEVHEMAVFDGITRRANFIPEELLDRGTAQLAARLGKLPVLGREMILADVERRLDDV